MGHPCLTMENGSCSLGEGPRLTIPIQCASKCASKMALEAIGKLRCEKSGLELQWMVGRPRTSDDAVMMLARYHLQLSWGEQVGLGAKLRNSQLG